MNDVSETAGVTDSTEISRALDLLKTEIQSFYEDLPELPVTPQVDPDRCRRYLRDRYDFAEPVPLADLVEELCAQLRKWTLHVTHPRCFGYFNPSVTVPAVIGDTMAALYNPQLAVWSTAPLAIEIENHVLSLFLARFGFDSESSIANFTSGGAEANMTAIVAALTKSFPDYGERGLGDLGIVPTIYLSAGGHESFIKAAHATGIGRRAIRRVPLDDGHRMDVAALAEMIEQDQDSGRQPLMVVGTAGTTAMGIIDPLPELAALCRRQELWLHVDAAWGGAAILSPTLATSLAGIELADSVTCDAHKWLSVPMGAGMFFCRHRAAVLKSFCASTGYMPRETFGTIDPYIASLQWSRRFIGLKVFMTLASQGLAGVTECIDHQTKMGQYLRVQLQQSGWRVVNQTPLPVVCFTHPHIESSVQLTKRIADAVVASGIAWISDVEMTNGRSCLRACVTSFRAQPADLESLVRLLSTELETLMAGEAG